MTTILDLLDQAAADLQDPYYRAQLAAGAEMYNPLGGSGIEQARQVVKMTLVALEDPEALRTKLARILYVLETA